MRNIEAQKEITSPEQSRPSENVERKALHEEHGRKLEEKNTIEEAPAKEKERPEVEIDKKFEKVKEKHDQFMEHFRAGGFDDKKETIKALGANLVTLSEAQDVKTAIAEEKAALEKRIFDMRAENPDCNRENNAEYKTITDRYVKLESYENSLSAIEGTLDGRNYDLSQEVDCPYLQQVDTYRYDVGGALRAVDKYISELERKCGAGEDTATDRFVAHFQKSRIEEALSYKLENGTQQEKAQAQELLARFGACENALKNKYQDFKLYDDGTVRESVSSEHAGYTLEKKETHIQKEGTGEVTTVETRNKSSFLSAEITKHTDSLLYTGQEIGKKVDIDVAVAKKEYEKTETTVNPDGQEILKESMKRKAEFLANHASLEDNSERGKISASVGARVFHGEIAKEVTSEGGTRKISTEVDVGNIEIAAEVDIEKGTASVGAEATGAHGKLSAEIHRGDAVDTFSAEVNLYHAKAEAYIDSDNLEMGASASADTADIKGKIARSINGEETSVAASLVMGGRSAEAEVNRFGAHTDVKNKNFTPSVSVNENGVTLIDKNSASPENLMSVFLQYEKLKNASKDVKIDFERKKEAEAENKSKTEVKLPGQDKKPEPVDDLLMSNVEATPEGVQKVLDKLHEKEDLQIKVNITKGNAAEYLDLDNLLDIVKEELKISDPPKDTDRLKDYARLLGAIDTVLAQGRHSQAEAKTLNKLVNTFNNASKDGQIERFTQAANAIRNLMDTKTPAVRYREGDEYIMPFGVDTNSKKENDSSYGRHSTVMTMRTKDK